MQVRLAASFLTGLLWYIPSPYLPVPNSVKILHSADKWSKLQKWYKLSLQRPVQGNSHDNKNIMLVVDGCSPQNFGLNPMKICQILWWTIVLYIYFFRIVIGCIYWDLFEGASKVKVNKSVTYKIIKTIDIKMKHFIFIYFSLNYLP